MDCVFGGWYGPRLSCVRALCLWLITVFDLEYNGGWCGFLVLLLCLNVLASVPS